MTDNEIIELFWERDEQAIGITAEKYQNYLCKISANILCDEQDVKECLNDAYLSVWNAIPPNRPENFRVYIGKIVRNLSINRLKSNKAKKRGGLLFDELACELNDCISSPDNVDNAIDEKELTVLIEKFLLSKPESKRNLFIRRYWFVCSISELSKEFNMSESKVTAILHRMRKELKNILETEGFPL